MAVPTKRERVTLRKVVNLWKKKSRNIVVENPRELQCAPLYLLPDSGEDDEECDVERGEHRDEGDGRDIT